MADNEYREGQGDDDDDDSDEEKNSTHTSDEEDASEDNVDAPGFTSVESVRQYLAEKLGLRAEHDDDQSYPAVLESLDLDGIVKYIKEGRATKVITMAGAGISTSAGIPDFRSPGTGLYDNLAKYDLPRPEAIFDIRFFKENPKPFYYLAKELYPGKFKPTPSHYLIKLLEEKGLLLRHYTQNIDTLEREAGISDEKLVEAHGAFHNAHCVRCNKEYPDKEWLKEKIFSEVIPYCSLPCCGGIIKPDIVFFGENLPERFFRCMMSDFKECDLLIILGTSLVVQPFASLINKVKPTCPRLLINMEKVGEATNLESIISGGGLRFEGRGSCRDVALLGPCDDGIRELSKRLDWEKELDDLISKKRDE